MDLHDAVIYGFPYKLRPKPKIAAGRGLGTGLGYWICSGKVYKRTSKDIAVHFAFSQPLAHIPPACILKHAFI